MKTTNGQNGGANRARRPPFFSREARLQPETPPDKLNGIAARPLTIIAEIVDYDSLHRALRERREALDLPFTEVDKAGGLASGHASKILSPSQIKRATLATVGFLAPALGAKLVLVEDLQSLEQLKKHFRTRQVKTPGRSVPWGRPGTQMVVSLRFVKRIARKGGEARARKLTPAQRSASARKAAKARWSSAFAPPGIAARPDGGGDGAR
jgi:hypothetical protein